MLIKQNLYILLGWFLTKIPGFNSKRHKRFSDFIAKNPGKNFHIEIATESKIWFYLNQAYMRYFLYKNRNLSHSEWQKIHWNDYADLYYKAREHTKVNEVFENYLQDAILRFNVKSVLNIGCGGLILEKYFSTKYPQIKFFGVDITDKSEEIFKTEIQPVFTNVNFLKMDIFENLDILKSVNLFFTYNCFMHFNKEQIECFFKYLSTMSSTIIGIFQEPYTTDVLSKIYKERDYCHNFEKYISQYGFTLLGKNIKGNFGVFYFINNNKV